MSLLFLSQSYALPLFQAVFEFFFMELLHALMKRSMKKKKGLCNIYVDRVPFSILPINYFIVAGVFSFTSAQSDHVGETIY